MDEKLLYRFFSNDVTLAERAAVREWAAASPANMRMFCREHNIYNAIVLSAGGISVRNRYSFRRYYRRQLLRIAGVMLLLLMAGFGTFYGLFGDRIVPIYSLTVPAGNSNNLLLPDGTKIWLNAGSTIKYPASFIGLKRVIDVEGEAYLEVTSQRRPFIVRTPGGEVKVLGTKFYVTSTPTEELMVSLMEGSVCLTAGDKSVVLKPGYRAQLKQGRFKQSVIRSFETELWKDGIYYFENQSFNELMAGFEKCFGVKIDIDSSIETSQRYTGKFYRYNGVQHALRALQYDFEFDYSWDKDRNTILITSKTQR